jgi:flagellar hook-associated protein 1
MSVSPLMSLGVKAMSANYAALQATGHNIANANVAGYSRQEAVMTTTQGQYTGSGFFGRGVDVKTIVRAHNEFLTKEAVSSRSFAAMDEARLTHLKALENVFKPGEMGLGYASSQLMNSLVDLSDRPSDMATRQVVLARASELASRFNEAGEQMDSLQDSVTATLKAQVASVNGLARDIAAVNGRITALSGTGQPANDLLDERERLIAKLAEHVQVSTIKASDGSVGVFIGGGQRLVLGNEAVALKVVPDDNDPSRSAIAVAEFGMDRSLAEGTLGSGSLAGLLRFQNDDLVAGRTIIGRMAASLTGALNEQQRRGVNLQEPLGTIASADIFGPGASLAIGHKSNARDMSGNFIGSVNISLTEPENLQASEYELAEDPGVPGAYVLTRLSDGLKRSVTNGATIDGMKIDFGVPGPQPGDSYLLQPVSRVVNGMRAMLSDPRDVAAASPLVATVAATNAGTAVVASLQITDSPLPFPNGTTSLTFTNNTGDYNWEVRSPLNVLLASGTGTWQANKPVPTSPQNYNGFSLQLNGVPRTGDVVSIAPTPTTALATSNGNAIALQALRDAPIVGGRSPTDAYAQALADIGVRVQTGKTASDISGAVKTQAELTRSTQAGVNLDEEAARLIQFQQSYQAAAKVLQVAQSLFDTMLQATGR